MNTDTKAKILANDFATQMKADPRSICDITIPGIVDRLEVLDPHDRLSNSFTALMIELIKATMCFADELGIGQVKANDTIAEALLLIAVTTEHATLTYKGGAFND